ncbi:MAG: TetR/AcrR family transcriptional regulator [Candidatus Cloacimonadales bacterium]|nr:TetR/AcrR family transcriptional regulator [Candidatus Cloacimonadales bacterium]
MSGKLNKTELKRYEIMSIAQSMFYQKSYDNTSVNMIIVALGISKGAFYHYFRSKEDLLDQLADKFTYEILEKLRTILEDDSLNAIQKLNQIFLQGSIYKAERFDFILTLVKTIYIDKNVFLRFKFNNKSVELSMPLMTKILEQGKQEGLFDIEDAAATARMILLFGISIASYNAQLLIDFEKNPENIHQVLNHFKTYQRSVERILGAPENSISAFDETFLTTLNNYYENVK